MFTFTVPAVPRKPGGKPRPKTWQRTNHDPRNPRARWTKKAKGLRAEKERIAGYARQACPRGWPLDAVYAIEVVGYWPDRVFGDADRLASLAMDALEGVAYRKDRQVAAQTSARFVDAVAPRTEVTVVAYDPSRLEPVITIELTERGS